LAARDYANAEKSFRYDLTRNAKNVWALNGLQKTLKAQDKTRETSLVQNEFKKASSGSDINFNEIKY
ncbi:MAG: hypothetical protein J7497_06825, partial [Chitinophagaceae bacterium]|nr:hypothetical protein [Chitinophagaceae bacterium]